MKTPGPGDFRTARDTGVALTARRPHVDRTDVLAFGVFAVVSGVVSLLNRSLRTARLRSDAAAGRALDLAAQLEEQATELARQVETSQRFAADVERANRELADAARHAEAAERRATSIATSILERIPDAFVACDRDWRVRHVNHHAGLLLRALGRAPEELLGRSVWEEFPAFGDTQFGAAARRAMAEGVTTDSEEHYPALGRWL